METHTQTHNLSPQQPINVININAVNLWDSEREPGETIESFDGENEKERIECFIHYRVIITLKFYSSTSAAFCSQLNKHCTTCPETQAENEIVKMNHNTWLITPSDKQECLNVFQLDQYLEQGWT